jgi:hypothetical protein
MAMITIEDGEVTACFGHGSIWLETWDDGNGAPRYLCFVNTEPGASGTMLETGRELSEEHRKSKPRISFRFETVEALDNMLKGFASLRELLVKHEATDRS